MSDGSKNIGGQVMEAIGEGVVKPAANEVKNMFADAFETATGSSAQDPQDPAAASQKKQENEDADQQKILEARRQIDWYKKIDEDQEKVRQENLRKEQQRLQAQQEEEKKEEQKKLQSNSKTEVELSHEQKVRTAAERKRGVGG